MGTDSLFGIEALIRAFHQGDTEIKTPIATMLGHVMYGNHSDLVSQAAATLGALGFEAIAAVPELLALFNTPGSLFPSSAGEALVAIDPDNSAVAQVFIQRVEQGRSDQDVEQAAGLLGSIGPAAKEACPCLRKTMGQTRFLPRTRGAVALSLGHIKGELDLTIPALTATLDEDVMAGVGAEALGLIGHPAADAYPKILERARGSNCATARSFLRALVDVSPDPVAAVPDLASFLDCDEQCAVAAEVLATLGPNASAAVPQLRRLAEHGPSRPSINSTSGLRAAKKALDAILCN